MKLEVEFIKEIEITYILILAIVHGIYYLVKECYFVITEFLIKV